LAAGARRERSILVRLGGIDLEVAEKLDRAL